MDKDRLRIFKNQFSKDSLLNAIILTNDNAFIKSVIEDEELIKELNFDLSDFMELILSTKDTNYIREKAMLIINNVKNDKSERIIDLPPNMTIGIEIESEGPNSLLVGDIIESSELSWKAEDDFSLDDGVEVISPVLQGDNLERSLQIKKICEFLKAMKQEITETCGGHIHIGANYLEDMYCWKNFLEIWGNAERILFIICNKEGDIPRSSVGYYAKPVSGNLEYLLGYEDIKIENEEDLIELALEAQDNEKWRSINFKNVGNEKNTIEIRISNGSIDYETWIDNINLFGGIMEASVKLSKIQKKDRDEVNWYELELLKKFQILKQQDVSEEEKLEALLFLAIKEEKRDIYRQRYKKNIEFIKDVDGYVISETEDNRFNEKNISIKLTPNAIGRKVFLGEEPINVNEYQEVIKLLEGILKSNNIEK